MSEWIHLGHGEWARVLRETWRRDALSATASNTRVWHPKHNLVGAAGEAVFSHVCGHPWNEGGAIVDGGLDFPGVDVKGTEYESPLLVFTVGARMKAPVYALVALELERRRGRLAGYATRAMLAAAPVDDFGYGPRHVLAEDALLTADEVLVRHFAESAEARVRAAA